MRYGSKILVGVLVFLVVLSVSATFYKTVILQDFDVTGVFVEFPTEDSSYVWFVYNNKEYELELETTNYQEIVTKIAGELGIPEVNLDADFLEYLATAYAEAEVTDTGEEIEETAPNGETSELTDELIPEDTTSAENSSEANISEQENSITETEI